MATTHSEEEKLFQHAESNEAQSESVVRNYMMWTGAAGIIPMPLVDMAAITALQLAMLNRIGDIYKIKFSANWGKSVIGSLVGTTAALSIGKGIGMNLVRSIPLIGSIVSVVVVPGFAAASTYALGKVFIAHFESGGTLLSFDPTKVKKHYDELFQKHLKQGDKPKTA